MKLDIQSKVAIGLSACTTLVGVALAGTVHLPERVWMLLIMAMVLGMTWSIVSVWRDLRMKQQPPSDNNRPNAVFEADASSAINAENAEFAASAMKMFPNGFAKASDNSLIHMPGFKLVDMGDGTFQMRFGGATPPLGK